MKSERGEEGAHTTVLPFPGEDSAIPASKGNVQLSGEARRQRGGMCIRVQYMHTHAHIHVCMHSTHTHTRNTQIHIPHTQCLSDIATLLLWAKIPWAGTHRWNGQRFTAPTEAGVPTMFTWYLLEPSHSEKEVTEEEPGL